jgi:hypothetical protein
MTFLFRKGSPCSADWEEMVGGERARYCSECNRNVYDFSRMSDKDVEQLFSGREQRVCARVCQRPDGTVTTPNLSVSLGVLMRRTSRAASIALAAAISVGLARAEAPLTTPPHNLFQIQKISGGLALTVVDATGAAITKAQVTILNESTKARVNGETDEPGNFEYRTFLAGNTKLQLAVWVFKLLSEVTSRCWDVTH